MDGINSRIAIGFSVLLLALSAHAETVYVQDTLRIGVRTETGSNSAPVGVVVTGMRLEVIERSQDYVKIRTDKGLEGWIKESYVATEKPAVIKFEELQQEYTQLKSNVGKHGDLLKDSETTNKSLNKELEEVREANADLRAELASLKEQSKESSGPYLLLVVSYLLIASAGVAAGIAWHRRQAMKRLGGLRV